MATTKKAPVKGAAKKATAKVVSKGTAKSAKSIAGCCKGSPRMAT